ncbi:MAG: phytoene/squalene synthase family protein [Pseudomonadota bacterium]
MDPIVALSRERIEIGSKSFAGAARLFDPDTRASAYMLYAWCRYCDDVIDGQELGFPAASAAEPAMPERLYRIDRQTREAMAGRSDEPVFEALARVTQKHEIPERHPLELIDGFRIDVERRPFLTLDDTLTYSYHVAGVVGVMMAYVMGVRERETLNRASDLGIAFQLTNIARDVIGDAAVGRVYLPEDWLVEAGVAISEVGDVRHRADVFGVTERLLDVADRYYESAEHGIADLPMRAGWAIAAARNVYRDIGNVIRARGPQAWDERAVVSKQRKLLGVAGGGLKVLQHKIMRPSNADAEIRRGLWTADDLGSPSRQSIGLVTTQAAAS